MYTIKKIWSSDVTELISKHASLDREEISGSENIVYKVQPNLIDKLNQTPSNLKQLKIRWNTKKVFLLTFAVDSFKLYLVEEKKLIEYTGNQKILDEIRNYDLNQLITNKSSDCTLKAPQGGHFVTPSGKHTKIFVRIGDAINSFNSMDRISFWLQGIINDDVSGIVIDSPSLLSVVAHVFNLNGKNIPFTCLSESVVGSRLSNKADSILKKFSTRVGDKGKILILISMSVSGTTEEAIIKRVKTAGIKNDVFPVSIFSLKDLCIEKICALDFDFIWYSSQEECAYCKNTIENKIYEIDGKTFFPKLSEQKTVFLKKSHVIKTDCKNGIDSFYQKYGKFPGVLRFHYSDKNDAYNSRHHAFSVHVLSLMKNPDFVDEFKERIRKIVTERGSIDLVIHPPHPAAKKIVEIAKSIETFKVIENSSLDPSIFHDVALLAKSKHILILDDVLITGGRQQGYLQNIRTLLTDHAHILEHITFFPLITRADNPKKLDFLKRSLLLHKWKNHKETLYDFLLPQWNAEHCPWCKEKKLLSQYIQDPLTLDDWLQNRLDLLDDFTGEGIRDNPLLYFDGMDEHVMSESSPIVEKGYPEKAVLFVLASGIQELRNDIDGPLGNNLLYSNLLCIDSLVQYNDQLIQTCLLRVTFPDEWTNAFYDELFNSDIRELFTGTGISYIPEVLMHAFEVVGNRKLPDKFFKLYKGFLSNPSVKQLIDELKLKS